MTAEAMTDRMSTLPSPVHNRLGLDKMGSSQSSGGFKTCRDGQTDKHSPTPLHLCFCLLASTCELWQHTFKSLWVLMAMSNNEVSRMVGLGKADMINKRTEPENKACNIPCMWDWQILRGWGQGILCSDLDALCGLQGASNRFSLFLCETKLLEMYHSPHGLKEGLNSLNRH